MQIREAFATKMEERIEPVVKVAERRPHLVFNELSNLVVTEQWERYLHQMLDAYTDAADREEEQGIGIWISGFFGSGKSLLLKVLGVLLEGPDLDGRAAHQIFLDRLPATSPDRSNLQRFLAICQRKLTTTSIGGNIHALQASADESLALLAFRLFAGSRGFTRNWPLAWAVEYHIDARNLTPRFRDSASDLCGMPWEDVAADPEFYSEQLYRAAADVLPEHFSGTAAVAQAVNSAVQSGITPSDLVDRLRRWCTVRDGGGRRHKLLLQLDELGQWIAGGNPTHRTMQVQALVETAAASGGGRIWIAVTAHGDVQAMQQNVQQEYYAKINQRFAIKAKLSNDDISKVVEERLLRKTQAARRALHDQFAERSGEIADLGTLVRPQRQYPAPDETTYPLFYPFLPWTVTLIPDVVKGIAQAANREEALTGSNRTMIGVVQGALIDTPGLLESPLGRILGLADMYDQFAADVPIETKTDLNRIGETVSGATALTGRVARGLFLLGQAKYIPTTLDNVARALVDTVDANLPGLQKQIKTELGRLVDAGYAKQVGEQYIFLTTQQRGFQEKVRARQEELLAQTYELIQALKEYGGEDAMRFDRVPVQGRELPLKFELDGAIVRNPQAAVPLRTYSPLQRVLDEGIGDDAGMQQRSRQEPNAIFFRLGEAPELRATLALALATEDIAKRVLASAPQDSPDRAIAQEARQKDLPSYRDQVRRLLGQAVRGGLIFFRGSPYQLVGGESGAAAVRNTLRDHKRISSAFHAVGKLCGREQLRKLYIYDP
ncbi:MAG TPA: hypothetical protein VLA19_32830 [Herpetosiphonaceae bacterium]|nr:hypothetical protein [Herpetosiphonaceae bacterium]